MSYDHFFVIFNALFAHFNLLWQAKEEIYAPKCFNASYSSIVPGNFTTVKPLNVITLVQWKTDNINRMITITEILSH